MVAQVSKKSRPHAGAGVPWRRESRVSGVRQSYVYGSYVDEILAILPASGVVGDWKFVHSNHLYSVAALTDNSGAVVERYRYDTYGQRTILEPDGVTTRAVSSYNQQVGFTGRYLDNETGLYYFRNRMYSGTLGRFVSRDSEEYVDGYHLYMAYFVPNGVDPTGLSTYWTIIEGSRALGSTGIGLAWGHLSVEYRKCECPPTDKIKVSQLYDKSEIEEKYKCTKIDHMELIPNRKHEAKHRERNIVNNKTENRHKPSPEFVWRTRSAPFSEIQKNSDATELIPLELFDDESTAKAKWDAMVAYGTSYNWAGKDNWPTSIYQTLGNNSNTFVFSTLKSAGYSHQYGFSRWHPGNAEPEDPQNKDDWGPLLP